MCSFPRNSFIHSASFELLFRPIHIFVIPEWPEPPLSGVAGLVYWWLSWLIDVDKIVRTFSSQLVWRDIKSFLRSNQQQEKEKASNPHIYRTTCKTLQITMWGWAYCCSICALTSTQSALPIWTNMLRQIPPTLEFSMKYHAGRVTFKFSNSVRVFFFFFQTSETRSRPDSPTRVFTRDKDVIVTNRRKVLERSRTERIGYLSAYWCCLTFDLSRVCVSVCLLKCLCAPVIFLKLSFSSRHMCTCTNKDIKRSVWPTSATQHQESLPPPPLHKVHVPCAV